MGSFLPVFLVFVLNCFGIHIFVQPKPVIGPFLSFLTFLSAVFILLWDVRLYPTSLRKLGRFSSFFMQFVIAAFLMEHLVSDFWIPLEESVLCLLPKISEFEEEIMAQSGFDCEGVLGFLRSENAGVIASYILSLFFFFSVLHATRIIDFRLLRCGIKVFTNDCYQRAKRMQRRMLRSLGLVQPKCVKFDPPDPPDDFECDEHYSSTNCNPDYGDCCDCECECDHDHSHSHYDGRYECYSSRPGRRRRDT